MNTPVEFITFAGAIVFMVFIPSHKYTSRVSLASTSLIEKYLFCKGVCANALTSFTKEIFLTYPSFDLFTRISVSKLFFQFQHILPESTFRVIKA